MCCLLISQLVLCSHLFFFFLLPWSRPLFQLWVLSFPVFPDSLFCSGVCPVVLLCSVFAEHKYAQNSRSTAEAYCHVLHLPSLGHPWILKFVTTFGYASYFSSFYWVSDDNCTVKTNVYTAGRKRGRNYITKGFNKVIQQTWSLLKDFFSMTKSLSSSWIHIKF